MEDVKNDDLDVVFLDPALRLFEEISASDSDVSILSGK